MTTQTVERPPFVVTHPRVTGFLLLLPVPLVLLDSLASRLLVPGDLAASASNILASESTFRLGIVSTLALFTVDAILAVTVFYPLLRPVGRNLAMLMVVLNLLGVATGMLNELSQLAIPLVLRNADVTAAFVPAQTQASLSLLLEVHDTGSLISGIFWGLWLVPYAILVFRSQFLPRVFAFLLLLECLGFVLQSLGEMVFPSLDLALLPAATSWVELFLPLWLLIKGIDVTRWSRHALAAA